MLRRAFVLPYLIKLTLAVASFALLAAATFFAAPTLLALVAAKHAAVAPASPSTAATASVPGRLESEHITIRPTGFEPAEITRPAGRVLLSVNDRSGLSDLDLSLDMEALRRLFRVRVPRDTKSKREWRQVVTLVPGRYVLTESDHPDWVCRITVTPN